MENVEGGGWVMDRKISRKLKGKVLDSCVVPASTYGMETLALSELHQHKLQVCENNFVKVNSRSKESGETENERPVRRSWN